MTWYYRWLVTRRSEWFSDTHVIRPPIGGGDGAAVAGNKNKIKSSPDTIRVQHIKGPDYRRPRDERFCNNVKNISDEFYIYLVSRAIIARIFYCAVNLTTKRWAK